MCATNVTTKAATMNKRTSHKQQNNDAHKSVERSRRTHENSYKCRQKTKKLRSQPARLQTKLHNQHDSKQIDNKIATIINKKVKCTRKYSQQLITKNNTHAYRKQQHTVPTTKMQHAHKINNR